jgi:hypothetical protein
MPEPPEQKDLSLAAMIERAVDVRITRLENVIKAFLAQPRRHSRTWHIGAAVLSLLGVSAGIAVGTWWGYGRGVEEMQQVFMTRGPEDVRAWLDLMLANPDIGKKEKQCEAGVFSHVTLSNGEHVCQIPLILHPVGMRRGAAGGE